MQNTIKPDFEQVINDNKNKIFRICRIYAVDPIEPEDLFQEVTYQIWKSFSTFENRSEMNTWVYRIALNVCMKFNQKLSRNGKTIQLESIRFEPPESIPDASQQEKHEALYGCIKELSEADQSIVILSLDEMPYKEIAGVTGLTENHIAVKMKRVRKVLLSCMTTKLR